MAIETPNKADVFQPSSSKVYLGNGGQSGATGGAISAGQIQFGNQFVYSSVGLGSFDGVFATFTTSTPGNGRIVIVADSGSNIPGTTVAWVSDEVSVPSAGRYSFTASTNFGAPVFVSGQKYWIGVWYQTSNTLTPSLGTSSGLNTFNFNTTGYSSTATPVVTTNSGGGFSTTNIAWTARWSGIPVESFPFLRGKNNNAKADVFNLPTKNAVVGFNGLGTSGQTGFATGNVLLSNARYVSEGGTLLSMEAYYGGVGGSSGETQSVRLVLFADNNGQPSTQVIAVTDAVTVSHNSTPVSWINFNSFSSFGGAPKLSPGAYYWPGLWFGGPNLVFSIQETNSGAASVQASGITYSTSSNPVVPSWGASGQSFLFSVYASYTTFAQETIPAQVGSGSTNVILAAAAIAALANGGSTIPHVIVFETGAGSIAVVPVPASKSIGIAAACAALGKVPGAIPHIILNAPAERGLGVMPPAAFAIAITVNAAACAALGIVPTATPHIILAAHADKASGVVPAPSYAGKLVAAACHALGEMGITTPKIIGFAPGSKAQGFVATPTVVVIATPTGLRAVAFVPTPGFAITTTVFAVPIAALAVMPVPGIPLYLIAGLPGAFWVTGKPSGDLVTSYPDIAWTPGAPESDIEADIPETDWTIGVPR